MDGIGSVDAIWRYPAKSMMGEQLDEVALHERGVLGDRGWAARDEVRGGIRGAKKIGSLMTLSARYAHAPTPAEEVPPLVVTLPDGTEVRSGDDGFDAAVSKALDHEVTLWPLQPAEDTGHYARGAPDTDDVMAELRGIFGRTEDEPLPDLSGMPEEIFFYESPLGTYYDVFPIHLITTASLRSLQRLLPDANVDVRRFRPNLVLAVDDDPDEPFPEQGWLGKRLAIGDVELQITIACPRCVMPTRGFADVPADRSILRTIVREADQNLGVYATVAVPGVVRAGDVARIID